VLSSNAVWHLYVVRHAMMTRAAESTATGSEVLASEMASGSAGMQALAGLAAVVLGILAIAMRPEVVATAGEANVVLFLVAYLVLGATLMLTGSTLSGAVVSLMPQRPGETVGRYGDTTHHPTQAE
jgi:hypothetical protein